MLSSTSFKCTLQPHTEDLVRCLPKSTFLIAGFAFCSSRHGRLCWGTLAKVGFVIAMYRERGPFCLNVQRRRTPLHLIYRGGGGTLIILMRYSVLKGTPPCTLIETVVILEMYKTIMFQGAENPPNQVPRLLFEGGVSPPFYHHPCLSEGGCHPPLVSVHIQP